MRFRLWPALLPGSLPSGERPPATYDTGRIRVLYVQDGADAAGTVRGLEDDGFEVVHERTGESGCFRASTEKFDVTVLSAFATSRAAAAVFRDQGPGGRIVHLASAYSFFGGINVIPYAASKGAVAQLMRSEAVEWAQYGIRVNAVAPGWVETEFTRALREDEVRFRDITGRITLGRWAAPPEIADSVAFLVSPAAGYLQGHILVADGGYLVR